MHDGTRIDVINDYHYHRWLGTSICFTRGYIHGHAIDSRIAAAMRAFYAKKYVFCAKNVSIGIRLRYFNSTISQIACFAGSSTTLSVQDCHALDVAFRDLGRKIVGHPNGWDYTRPHHELLHAINERLTHFCNQNNVKTWSIIARSRQWQFVGNILRGDNQNWCCRLFNWIPLGKRSRGRPYARFQDQFNRYWTRVKQLAQSLNHQIQDHWVDIVHDHHLWTNHLPHFLEFHSR